MSAPRATGGLELHPDTAAHRRRVDVEVLHRQTFAGEGLCCRGADGGGQAGQRQHRGQRDEHAAHLLV
jgi:hypothetical protein